MATLIKNPDANPETNTVDGTQRNYTVGSQAFVDILASPASQSAEDTNTTCTVEIVSTSTNNQYNSVRRYIALFDTSSLKAGSTVLSAVLSVYISSKNDGFGGQSLVVASATTASNTALAATDSTGSNAFSATLAITSVTTSAYNDLTLNASGIAAISLTGITKLSIKFDSDRSGVGPSWASSNNCNVVLQTADAASNKPKLTVTYTTPFITKTMFFSALLGFSSSFITSLFIKFGLIKTLNVELA